MFYIWSKNIRLIIILSKLYFFQTIISFNYLHTKTHVKLLKLYFFTFSKNYYNIQLYFEKRSKAKNRMLHFFPVDIRHRSVRLFKLYDASFHIHDNERVCRKKGDSSKLYRLYYRVLEFYSIFFPRRCSLKKRTPSAFKAFYICSAGISERGKAYRFSYVVCVFWVRIIPFVLPKCKYCREVVIILLKWF